MRTRRDALCALGAGGLAASGCAPAVLRGPDPGEGAPARFGRGPLAGFNHSRVPREPEAFVDELAATGARLLRVALPAIVQDGAIGWSDPDGRDLGRVLDRCERHRIGMVVALDLGGGQTHGLWLQAGFGPGLLAAWRRLARRLDGHPALAGLDLLNEPDPPRPQGDLARAQAHWGPVVSMLVHGLRADGIGATLVIEPVLGGLPQGFAVLDPVDDERIVYSVHQYLPHEITHQGVAPTWRRAIPYPAGPEWGLRDDSPPGGDAAWGSARLAWTLRHVVAFGRRVGRPIYVGEFSCVRSAPGGSADRYVTDCIALFDTYGWSWTYHEFQGWPGWDAGRRTPAELAGGTAPALMDRLRDRLSRRAEEVR